MAPVFTSIPFAGSRAEVRLDFAPEDGRVYYTATYRGNVVAENGWYDSEAEALDMCRAALDAAKTPQFYPVRWTREELADRFADYADRGETREHPLSEMSAADVEALSGPQRAAAFAEMAVCGWAIEGDEIVDVGTDQGPDLGPAFAAVAAEWGAA